MATQLCTSLGRTDAIRRPPSDVPSSWRVMNRSTRNAVDGRCGRPDAQRRAYSATVVRSVGSTHCPRCTDDSSSTSFRCATAFVS